MLLSPEIVVAETAAREVTLRLEDLLLPIIAMGWLARIALYKELGLILKTSLNRPILCYILVSLISTGFGVISGRVGLTPGFLFVVKYIEFFIVYFMVVNHVSTEKQVRNFTIAILVTAGIIAIYAIMQIPFEARVSAPFEGGQGEPNTLGGYLVLIISLAIGLMITLKDRRLKVLLSGLLLLLMIPFLHTLSRSSWMAFGGMYLFYLIKGQRKVFFILILLLLISLLPIILPQEVKERYSETVSKKPIISSEQVKVGKYYLDLSASERVRSWRKILKDWKNKPVFGYGITGYGFVDGQYFRTLIESGLIGFMTLIYLIYSMITTFYKGFTLKTPFHKGLSIGLLAGVVALSAHAVGSNTFVIVRIMEPLWFLAGLAVVLPRIEETV
ncbi:MAG: O-antigen ligase family protein [Thermodesulfobacteriota bacterium]